ncbi:MAG: hypothetical protein OK436_04675 [Thaumarchaeota archaeon]|nr:hypothetical protein [Nitrososphaerota archaeon]
MRLGVSIVMLETIFLVALQVGTLAVLWLLKPLTQSATDTFALYLSMNLVAFAIISYTYRSIKNGRAPSQTWKAIGYLVLMVLVVSNLVLA